jgi:hypothetical protein
MSYITFFSPLIRSKEEAQLVVSFNAARLVDQHFKNLSQTVSLAIPFLHVPISIVRFPPRCVRQRFFRHTHVT